MLDDVTFGIWWWWPRPSWCWFVVMIDATCAPAENQISMQKRGANGWKTRLFLWQLKFQWPNLWLTVRRFTCGSPRRQHVPSSAGQKQFSRRQGKAHLWPRQPRCGGQWLARSDSCCAGTCLERRWSIMTLCSVSSWYHADISCWYIMLYASSSQEEEATYFKTRPMPSSSILLRDHIQVLRAPPRCEYILTATGTGCTKLGGLAKLGILGVSQISDICIISVYSIHIFYSYMIHILFK